MTGPLTFNMNVLATVAGYPVDHFHDLPLSARMRGSWKTRRFWLNYASRRSLDVDAVYWATLHDSEDPYGLSLLDSATRENLAPLMQETMEQLNADKAEYATRFIPKACP